MEDAYLNFVKFLNSKFNFIKIPESLVKEYLIYLKYNGN